MGLFTDATDWLGITDYAGVDAMMGKANALFQGLTPPELKALDLEIVGQMNPDQAQAFLSQGTAFSDIEVDPRLKAAQMSALTELQDISSAEGMRAQDKALLERIFQQEAQTQKGSRDAILQNAQMRGVGGSGLELASQISNQQASASRQSQRDLEVAAMAEQRKMDALLQAGQLGGQMRGQEFGEQSQIAQAKDLVDRFNLSNQQNTEFTNVDARNRAQAYNLQTAQDIANKEGIYNAGLAQQNYQNQLGLASAQAGAYQNVANAAQAQNAAMMQAGGTALGIYAASDMTVKKDIDISPDEIDDFLNSLTGYKFSYKDPEKHGEGERLGIMAQDMEKTPMGKDTVQDIDGVKNIDSTKALHAVLAGVSRINERLNKVEDKDGER